MNKVVQWLITITAGLVFFVIFLFWFFPYNLVVGHYLAEIEKQTKGAYRITVGDMQPSVLFKSRFKNSQFHQISRKGEDTVLADFSELKIGVSYISLLADHLKGSFTAKGKKGTIEGTIFISSSERKMDLTFKDFEITGLPVLLTALPLHFKPDAKVSGTVRLSLEADDYSKTDGEVKLKITSLKTVAGHVGSGPMFSLDLPDLEFSTEKQPVQIESTIKKGKVTLKNFSIPGEDVSLNLTGTVQLTKRLELSSVNVAGSFKVSDHLKESLGIVMAMIDKQKKEDGSYPLELSGKISEPTPKIGTFDLAGFKEMPTEGPVEPAPEAPPPVPAAPAPSDAAPPPTP